MSPEKKYGTFLIVEDDPTSEFFLKEILDPYCKGFLTATNGETAIELLKHNQDIELILMDIRMPGIGGLEATRRIREFNEKVIIIIQTAYATKGDEVRAMDSGASDYIAKPILEELLLELIEKQISKQKSFR